jgi:hypothetical protein
LNVPLKLGGFVAALVAVFGAATGVGAALGPLGAAEKPVHDMDDSMDMSGDEQMDMSGPRSLPKGLMVSQEGYTLRLLDDRLSSGGATGRRFSILGPDGRSVTDYRKTHDKDLHLIVVRRDMTGFQHVHPKLGGDGIWTVSLALGSGQWRVFADFQPAGLDEAITLGADLSVEGAYAAKPLPASAPVARVDDYSVSLKGRLVAGKESTLTLSVSKDGKPVTDLQTYLAAYGHLVVLRDDDLAYLHVHPEGAPGDGSTAPGPDITFTTTAPSRGTYRLFLDFRHEDSVRTAEFSATAQTGTPDRSRERG